MQQFVNVYHPTYYVILPKQSHAPNNSVVPISLCFISKNDTIATSSNIPTLSSNLPNHADVILYRSQFDNKVERLLLQSALILQ